MSELSERLEALRGDCPCPTPERECAAANECALLPYAGDLANLVIQYERLLEKINCDRVVESEFKLATCNFDQLPMDIRCARCRAVALGQQLAAKLSSP